jgi:hypothetical protein
MPKTKQKTLTARAAAPADQATMVVTLYDGTREPIASSERGVIICRDQSSAPQVDQKKYQRALRPSRAGMTHGP